MKTIYLSYYINNQTPLYGGEKVIEISLRSKISKGASSNTQFLKFPNHTGTHIDFPRHFSDIGKTINDYPAGFWVFKKVFVIRYEAKPEEIIDDKLLKAVEIPKDIEFLIIYTGFGKNRGKEIYWKNNPGLAHGLAEKLKQNFPELKAIGFDFISVSSYQNRILGREAHKTFLIENDLLIIEDMKLDELKGKKIKTITALPLLIDKADGSPIAIIAEYE